MGGEAVRELLRQHRRRTSSSEELRKDMRETTTEAKRKKIAKRLKVVEAFRDSAATSRSG